MDGRSCNALFFCGDGDTMGPMPRRRDDELPAGEELAALALAADLDQPVGEGAVPVADYLAELASPEETGGSRRARLAGLPEWYMPVLPSAFSAGFDEVGDGDGPDGRDSQDWGRRRARRWQIAVVALVVAAFVGVDATGLCSTYGLLSLA